MTRSTITAFLLALLPAWALAQAPNSKALLEAQARAQGFSGDFSFEVKPDGYIWSHPAGPGAIIRYEATFKDGAFTEIGERVAEGQPRVRTFEMHLRRVSDTDWPAAGAIAQR